MVLAAAACAEPSPAPVQTAITVAHRSAACCAAALAAPPRHRRERHGPIGRASGLIFYAYGNGTWLRSAEIPADRSSTGPFLRIVEQVEARTKADPRGERRERRARRVGASEDRRLLRQLPRRSGRRSQGARAAQAFARPHRQDWRCAHARGRALRGDLRADVDPLNNPNFQTEHLFGLWAEQDLNDPSRVAPYLLQGGLGMPDEELLHRDDARDGGGAQGVRRVPRDRLQARRCRRGGSQGQGWPGLRAREEDGHRARVAGRLGGREEGQQPVAAEGLHDAGAEAWTGARTSRRPASTGKTRSSCGTRPR